MIHLMATGVVRSQGDFLGIAKSAGEEGPTLTKTRCIAMTASKKIDKRNSELKTK